MFVNALKYHRALQRSRRFLSFPTLKTKEAEIAGLLVGANDTHFTTSLNLVSAANLVQNSDAIFRAAIAKDAENSGEDVQQYLSEIETKASKYLLEDDICGRSTICANIKKVMLQKGSLTFITGGFSVGKSKIVASIVQAIGEDQVADINKPSEERVSVILVDGRQQQDLIHSLHTVATQQTAAMAIQTTKVMSTDGFDFRGINFSLGNVADAVEALANQHPQNTNHTVLILDEADLFFNRADEERAVELFHAVVRYTKQLTRMSVVLVSSDARLLNHLLDLGLNPNHISKTLVISEPTPRESSDLLRNQFGVGEHLSAALVDCYGGNVYQMCKQLQWLPFEYNKPQYAIKVFLGPATDISNAMGAWVADNGDEAEILKVLEELSRTGFVPMSSNNKLARLLTKYNVCVYLTEDAVEYQVPKELRAMEGGLVPSSQLARMLIAWKLVNIKNEKSRAGK